MSIKKPIKFLFSLLVINTFAFGLTSNEKVTVLNYNRAILKANDIQNYENKQVYVNDQNETRTIYWTKGIEAPKMANDTKLSNNDAGFFRKYHETINQNTYSYYYYPMEDDKGYYDFNKNPNDNKDYPQQVAHHCFLSNALNLIYWWFDQNSSYIDKYVSLLGEGYFPQDPKLHEINNPEMWAKYRARPHLENVSIKPNSPYKSMDLSNNSMYREVFRSFQWRDEGYWPDLVWDSFFNGFEPDNKDIKEKLHMPKKDSGFFYPLLGKTSISKAYSVGSYEYFGETLLKSIVEGKGIGLAYQSAGPAHAITIWGAEYDDKNQLKRVYYTDSDDFDSVNDVYDSATVPSYKVLKGLYSNEVIKDKSGMPNITTRIGATSGSLINEIFTLDLAQDKLESSLGDLADPIAVQFKKDLPNLGYKNDSEELRTLEVEFKKPDNGLISYQWYEASSLESEGTLIQGATKSFYKPTPINGQDKYYYCVVTNTKHNKSVQSTTNRSRVFIDPNVINAVKPIVSYFGTNKEVQYNRYDNPSPIKVRVDNVLDGEVTYQWFKKESTSNHGPVGGTLIEGAIYDTYYPETHFIDNASEYYCEVTNTNLKANGLQSVTSAPPKNASILVLGNKPLKNALKPNIILNPISEINYSDGSDMPVLKAYATVSDGGKLSYQWYEANDASSTGEKIIGETFETFTPTPTSNETKYYYCEITNTNDVATLNQTASTSTSRTKVQISGLVSHDASLKEIKTTSGTLTPDFSKTTYSYDLNLPHNVSETTITGIASSTSAKVTGNTKVTLKNDESKEIKLIVTAEDGSTTKTYTINVKRPSTIKEITVQGEYVYDGNKQDVTVVVKNTKDEILKLNEDYKIVYTSTNRTNVGTVNFKIVGLNSYAGYESSSSFKIKAATIKEENISISATEFTFNNNNQKPTITITFEGKTLLEDTDYEVSFPKDIKNFGTKEVTITGIGNFDFTYTFTYSIKKATNTVSLTVTDGEITSTSTYGDVSLKYFSDAEGKVEIEAPTEPGTYYVKGYVLESTNYNYGESALVQYVIEDTTPEPPVEPDPDPETKPDVGPDVPTEPDTKPDVDPDKPNVEPDKPTEPDTDDKPNVEPDKPSNKENNDKTNIIIYSVLGASGGVILIGIIIFVIISKKKF